MQAGLYNSENELIYNWKNLIRTNEIELNNTTIEGCNRLMGEKLIIAEGINKIDAYAFAGCIYLREIQLSNTIETINNYAFNHCISLTAITLSKKLKKINTAIFNNCSSMKEIKYPGTETEFKAIEGWEHIFDNNKLTIDDIIFQKTLEDLIKEGYTLTEANRELKQQQEER